MNDSRKYKVIVKRPDEQYGHSCHISCRLENLQNTVGGYVEQINFGKYVILCNEDGKALGLEKNMNLKGHQFVGTIIVTQQKDGEIEDLEVAFKEWKKFVDENQK